MAAKAHHKAFLPRALLLLALTAAPALGAETDEVTRAFGFPGDEPAAVSRFPRPASLIAENITVITAQEIARLNAHTVADVLQTLPGIQLDQMQTPGSAVFFSILGSTSRHILVQIDGVPQNFISADNLAEIGNMPAQIIERIEVVKGAASAAWGSALGGVVNIVTKSPSREGMATGVVSASSGRSSTRDLRGELTGSVQRLGYYLSGGNLRSDGLVPGNGTDFSHGFGKLTYRLPGGGVAELGLEARHNSLGLGDSVSYDYHDSATLSFRNGYLSLKYPLAERLSLELSGRGGVREYLTKWGALSVPDLFMDTTIREEHRGAAASLSYGDALASLKGGVEFEHVAVRGREFVHLAPEQNFDLTLERWAAYLNGSYTVGRVSILPGVRVERINLLENPVSYTLGATLRLTESTLLRGYAARGYSMPLINNLGLRNGQRELQQVKTIQAGVESAAVPYLWLKGTLFYNRIWNIQSFDTSVIPALVTLQEQVRQGVDLELRTSPVYGFALTGTYTFTDSRDRRSKEMLYASESGPRHGAKVGFTYNNERAGLSGALTGNYVRWHMPQGSTEREDPVWDLHLTRLLFPDSQHSAELFFSLRNIFDGDQYQVDFRPNAPRWFEAGVRFPF